MNKEQVFVDLRTVRGLAQIGLQDESAAEFYMLLRRQKFTNTQVYLLAKEMLNTCMKMNKSLVI